MNNMETYDLIVVGGGIAGLYCAMELSKTKKVLLLEAGDRLGGRIHTHEHPQYEIGAGRLHAKDTHLLALLKHFHLTILPLPSRIDHINATDGYVPHVDLYIKEMVRKATRTLNEERRHLSFEDHCLSILGKEDTQRLQEARGYAGDFQMNAYDTIRMLRREERGGFYVVREGLGQLVERMRQATKATIRLNHIVKDICFQDNLYEVDGYKAKQLVVALPVQAILSLQSTPLFYPPLFQSVSTIPLIRIYAKYPSPVWFEGLPHMTTSFVSGHMIPIRDGLIMIAYTEKIEPFVHKGRPLPKKELKKKIKEELKHMFPFLSIPDPEWVEAYLWDTGYHAWKPGVHSGLVQKEINHLSPGLFFCGEAFSTRQGWVEGALETAVRVVHHLS